MRFAHSFWTKPALGGRWHIDDQLSKDLWLFALSAHYVKAHDHDLVLHTDAFGEKIFGVLPYDEIHRTLDDMSVPVIFWAAGKMHTLGLESLGTVHIDGDVFLKKPEIYQTIATPGCDLVVQSYDWYVALPITTQLLRPYLVKRMGWLFANDDAFSDETSTMSYNCGVLCFRNQDLRDRFLAAYALAVQHLSRSRTLCDYLYQSDDHLSVDLVLEQKLLRALTRSGGYKVRRIISGDGHWLAQRDQYCEQYEHLIYKRKYTELEAVKETLERLDPGLHARVAEHARDLQ